MVIKKEELFFDSKDKIGRIYARLWLPEQPCCVIQICHGMAEHISRYEQMAVFLAENNIAVCGIDWPGHGKSVGKDQVLGYINEKNGWELAAADHLQLKHIMQKNFADLPYFLFGHSMGSFMSRYIAAKYNDEAFAGFIWSGTAGTNKQLGAALRLAKAEVRLRGAKAPSRLLNHLSFGAYNKHFKPARTEFDWLSRDTKQVDKYIEDPFCGFCFTAGGFLNLFLALQYLQTTEWAQAVPDLPILIYGGTADPVGNCGNGILEVVDALDNHGHTQVKYKLFDYCRHEVHNELNPQEAYNFILNWIFHHLNIKTED